MDSEMMTLQEVCNFFRVEKRVLQRYGLERLGGVRLGPRSWRFPRNEVLKYGVQKSEQKQGQIPVDGSTIHREKEGEEVLRDEERRTEPVAESLPKFSSPWP
jgi:hypothetical protein